MSIEQFTSHFVGKNKDIVPILSSSPNDVLALLPDAKVEGFGSKSIEQFTSNTNYLLDQYFLDDKPDEDKITPEKLEQVEAQVKVALQNVLGVGGVGKGKNKNQGVIKVDMNSSQNERLIRLMRAQDTLIPDVKVQFSDMKTSIASLTNQVEWFSSTFPRVEDFSKIKNQLLSAKRDFNITSLSALKKHVKQAEGLLSEFGQDNLNFIDACLNISPKSQVAFHFIASALPATIDVKDFARETIRNSRRSSEQFFTQYTPLQIRDVVDQLPGGAFILERELKLHAATIRNIHEFDAKRLPILRQYHLASQCKTFASCFKKLGCVNQAGSDDIQAFASSASPNPKMIEVLSPYANNAAFTRMIALLDKESAKIRGFLTEPDRKFKVPAERTKLFNKIREIQQKLDKSTEQESSLIRMNNFVLARDFLFASALDAFKIDDDAAPRDVIADIKNSPALIELLKWSEKTKNDMKLLLDIEQAVTDLNQNVDEIRDIFDQDDFLDTKSSLELEKISDDLSQEKTKNNTLQQTIDSTNTTKNALVTENATLRQTVESTQNDLVNERSKNETLEESKKLLEETLAKKEAILAKLQSAATSDMIRESMTHFRIADTVSHDQLCSIRTFVAPLAEHLAQNPVTRVLTNSIEQQSAKILALRDEVAKFQSELAWLASTFPQVEEFSALNSRLLIINNFNSTSICDLEKEIDNTKKLLPVVLDANTRSLIDNTVFNDCVKDQNPQKINSLSQCWLAIRVAELETIMFNARKTLVDQKEEHQFVEFLFMKKEFELAQQRGQIEIDERITRERSILEEEEIVRQIVEDTHHVGLEILMREEIGAFSELFKEFSLINSELDKFNWFRLACHELTLKFPADFTKDNIIQMLEIEKLHLKEEFLEVTDQTLKTCGFPGAIINRLRKVIDHLSSAASFSSPAVQQLLDEVKSQLPGVTVFSPADVPISKTRANLLGEGGYGSVYGATIISQRNRRCAAKVFESKSVAFREAKNLVYLDNTNVVRLLGVTVEDTPNPCVVLLFERADCDLKRFFGSTLSVPEARHYAEQIACGLDYLHHADSANDKRRIVHLDLKPENILVFRFGTSITLKISDLGFVHEMESSTTTEKSNFAATERYLSPETRIDRRNCRNNSNYKVRVFPAIDIFAFGVILLQMIAPTWYKRQGREQMQTKIDDVIHNEALLQSNECCIDDFKSEVGDCDDLVKLAKDCLMINRAMRPKNGRQLLERLRPQLYVPVNNINADDDDHDDEYYDGSNYKAASDAGESTKVQEKGQQGAAVAGVGGNSASNYMRNSRSVQVADEFPNSTSETYMPQTGNQARNNRKELPSALQALE